MREYTYVMGMKTPIGWVYKIQGDFLGSFTKKDCEHRIRVLFKNGEFDRDVRDYLLNDLKSIKRP